MTDLQMLKSYHYKFTGTGPCQKVDVFSTPDKIFWGAFFGDVEHEVRPSPVQRRCAGGACWVTSCDTEHSDPLRGSINKKVCSLRTCCACRMPVSSPIDATSRPSGLPGPVQSQCCAALS
eukprot:7898430-Pyramimonas_sp.AAC.1